MLASMDRLKTTGNIVQYNFGTLYLSRNGSRVREIPNVQTPFHNQPSILPLAYRITFGPCLH